MSLVTASCWKGTSARMNVGEDVPLPNTFHLCVVCSTTESSIGATSPEGTAAAEATPSGREGASTPSAVDPSFIFSTVSIILSIESCRFGAGPSRSTTCLPCKKCVAALSVSSTISVTISQSWESKVPVETFSSFKTASTWWKESKLPEASVVGASTGIGPWVSSGMMRSKLTGAPDMAAARIEGVERKTFNFSHLRDKSSWAKMAVPFWLWMFAHIILASASTASSKVFSCSSLQSTVLQTQSWNDSNVSTCPLWERLGVDSTPHFSQI